MNVNAAGGTAVRNAARVRWHHSPIFWLAAALFVASLLGCVLTIVLAVRNADPALDVGGEQLLGVPSEQARYAPAQGLVIPASQGSVIPAAQPAEEG
jgi:hypothetical protein